MSGVVGVAPRAFGMSTVAEAGEETPSGASRHLPLARFALGEEIESGYFFAGTIRRISLGVSSVIT
jgi:hypothetical protein